MNKPNIEAVLSQAKGRHFIYNEQRHKLLRYEVKDSVVRIVTDVQDISVLHADFDNTFQQFEILAANETVVATMDKTIVATSAMDLKIELMENIRKVKESKDYIPQAQAVRESVDTLISLAKAEVETMKAVRQLYGGQGV